MSKSTEVTVTDERPSLLEWVAILAYFDNGTCDYCGHRRPVDDDTRFVVVSKATLTIKGYTISAPIPHHYRVCSEDCFGCILRQLIGENEVTWDVS